MSREERRQYQRMMRNMERGPSLPPAAQARIERQRARRAQQPAARRGDFTAGFWVRAIGIALVVGFLGLSVQWTEGMPRSLYAGVAAAVVALVVVVGFRLFQRRAARIAAGPGTREDQPNP
jgi:hypothetical protein